MIARRSHWAALACALWVLGFDVVPLGHIVFHEALEDHHHGHDHHHAHQDDGDQPLPAEHGEGSVAHRDLAANVPLPQVPEILEALLTWDAPEIASHDEQPAERRPRTTRARAPPTVTA